MIIMVDPYSILIAPWYTEKSMDNRLPDRGNRLEFIVRLDSNKPEIAAAVEQLFEVRVEKVNTRITKRGKHASVRLAEGYNAEEASLKLGAF